MGFGGLDALGAAVIQNRVVKRTRRAGLVVIGHGFFHDSTIQTELVGQLTNRLRLGAFKHGWHETANGFGVND